MSTDPTTPPETGAIRLSVVIIAENEAENIRACIESVFDACRDVPDFEVILVDSDSTDRTVDIASAYPITILRIPDEYAISCGAGRFVGDSVARGEMVLHIDGDMVLTETWLPRAIERLQEPDVAGVEGCLDESTQTEVLDVDKIGGVMLYDATALREIGGFDPYMLGYEDVEVGFQLKNAGYRLLRLPEVSAIHHDEDSVSEPLRRWRAGYLTAPGQAIRKWVKSPRMLSRLIRRQRYKFALFAWACVGALAMLSTPLVVGWLLLSALGFAFVASKQGVAGAVEFFVGKGLGVVGLARGLRQRTPDAGAYPLDAVEVVAEGEDQQALAEND